jgi:hypothetical protein
MARTTSLIPLLVLSACGPLNQDKPGVGDTATPGTTGTPGTSGGAERLCQVEVTCFGNILDEPKAPCEMLVTDADNAPLYAGPAGIEMRGRSSLLFPKPQYAVELRDYTELPVWPGSVWSYLDTGVDPGPNWMNPTFDDTSWKTGGAPLGAGEGYLSTNIAAGAVTTWYRYPFSVSSLPDITKGGIGLMRNDGAVVYLNGTEIMRDNLPEVSDAQTLALTSTSGPEELQWVHGNFDPALLVSGTNVLAVEVHQSAIASPDSRFDLWLEATGDDASTDFFDMGADADWILNGQYVDRALFRNRLAFDLFQSFGGTERYATQTKFCEMKLNGVYEGVYTLGEKIEKDTSRIEIDAGDAPGDTFVIKLDDAPGFRPNGVGAGNWQMVYPDNDPTAEAAVSQYLDGFESAVLGPNPADPSTGVFAYVDMDSAVDWVLLEEFMKNADAYQWSVYLWKDQGGLMHFTPWDFDLSMGYPYTDCGSSGWDARTFLATGGGVTDIAYIQAMESVPAFRDRLVTRWQELRQNQMSDANIQALIAGYDATLAPGIGPNFDRWPMQDIKFTTDYVDNWLCPVSTYDDEHQRVLDFIAGRLAWMDANISTF